MGKVSQAVVVAGAAYRDEAAFAKITGITNVKMIDDKGKTDVQVRSCHLDHLVSCFRWHFRRARYVRGVTTLLFIVFWASVPSSGFSHCPCTSAHHPACVSVSERMCLSVCAHFVQAHRSPWDFKSHYRHDHAKMQHLP
jgi:hypothetical protein